MNRDVIDFSKAIRVDVEQRNTLPECAGVYVFVSDGQPFYVGETGNLRRRLRWGHHIVHVLRKEYASAKNEIFAFVMANKTEAWMSERDFILALRPSYNFQKLSSERKPIEYLVIGYYHDDPRPGLLDGDSD